MSINSIKGTKRAISSWKKVKSSGNFKRKVLKKYLRMRMTPTATSTAATGNMQIENNTIDKDDDQSSGEIEHSCFINNDMLLNTIQTTRLLPQYDNRNSSASDMGLGIDFPPSEIEIDKNVVVREKLMIWAISHKITHYALKDLFTIWNFAITHILPKDPRTFLETPTQISLKKLQNGYYWHNGLVDNLNRVLQKLPDLPSLLSLNVNVDGLPIYNSSRSEFWPILCNIQEIPEVKPLIIGIFCGEGKPASLTEFLEDFVREAKQAMTDGIVIKCTDASRKHVIIKIRSFICDSPARAYIKGKN